MAFFNNKRKDFSIQPPRQQVDGTPFFVTDSANIDFTLENLNLTANLTTTGVTSGTYGSPTLIPILEVDQWGRITGVTTTPFSASGIALETNSFPNDSQTILNLIDSATIQVVDLGGGDIEFNYIGSGGTYTADNGITETANNFQLGGPLVQNTLITNSGFYLRFLQSSGKALELYSNDAEALLAQRANTSRNTIDTVARLVRKSTTNPLGIWSQSGFGAALDYDLMLANGTTVTAASIATRWDSPQVPLESGILEFSTRNAGVLATQMTLNNFGSLGLFAYGVGTFIDTPVYALGVTAVGNVIEYTPTVGTGTVTNVATGTGLTGGPITTTGTISLNSKLAPADTLVGNAGKFLRVNSGESAVEYADVASGGGGGGRSYYLNGSVIQGDFPGILDMREISPVPVIGTGTDFTINTNGYIKSFITDAGDPNKAVIPAGNWNFELWFSVNNPGGSPSFYVELSKYDGAAFTTIATGIANPTNITTISTTLYITALGVPLTTLLLTDRLAVRIFVNHGGGGRIVTLHTQGPHLSQIITDFPSGITSLNGLTAFVQNFATPGTTGAAPNWSSALDAHTLNIPLASAAGVTAGLISKTDFDVFTAKLSSTLPNTQILVGNASNVATAVPMSGDVTIANTGAATLDPNYKEGGTTAIFDGGGSLITNGKIAYVRIPYKGTITGWFLAADQLGSCSIAVKQSTFAAFPPTGAAIITAALSGTQTATATISLPVAAGDWLSFTISGVATITWVNLSILITKTL
jgi:hypothetical protein